jgi:hypothetical protein
MLNAMDKAQARLNMRTKELRVKRKEWGMIKAAHHEWSAAYQAEKEKLQRITVSIEQLDSLRGGQSL